MYEVCDVSLVNGGTLSAHPDGGGDCGCWCPEPVKIGPNISLAQMDVGTASDFDEPDPCGQVIINMELFDLDW